MSKDSDCRLQGQEKYLQGVVLRHRRYPGEAGNADSDHDHCEFCWAKFMAGDQPDLLHVGYCTEDRRHWICERCFGDFRARFGWIVGPDGDAA